MVQIVRTNFVRVVVNVHHGHGRCQTTEQPHQNTVVRFEWATHIPVGATARHPVLRQTIVPHAELPVFEIQGFRAFHTQPLHHTCARTTVPALILATGIAVVAAHNVEIKLVHALVAGRHLDARFSHRGRFSALGVDWTVPPKRQHGPDVAVGVQRCAGASTAIAHGRPVVQDRVSLKGTDGGNPTARQAQHRDVVVPQHVQLGAARVGLFVRHSSSPTRMDKDRLHRDRRAGGSTQDAPRGMDAARVFDGEGGRVEFGFTGRGHVGDATGGQEHVVGGEKDAGAIVLGDVVLGVAFVMLAVGGAPDGFHEHVVGDGTGVKGGFGDGEATDEGGDGGRVEQWEEEEEEGEHDCWGGDWVE